MENFCARIKLASPMVVGRFAPTLDALLSWVRWMETGNIDKVSDLPLKQTNGVFHASMPVLARRPIIVKRTQVRRLTMMDIGTPEIDWGYPRLELDKRKTGTNNLVDVQPGVAHYAVNGRHLDTTLFYYGCGDLQAVQGMLESVPGVGRRAHTGCGEIRAIHIGEIDRDYGVFDDVGRPMRPVPVERWRAMNGRASVSLEMANWRPSYSDGARTMCAVPDLPFLIKRENADVHD